MRAAYRRRPGARLLLTLAAALFPVRPGSAGGGELWETWQSLTAGTALFGAVIAPVAKCVGLGLLTGWGPISAGTRQRRRRYGGGADRCVCALLAASPLMVLLFEMIGGYV